MTTEKPPVPENPKHAGNGAALEILATNGHTLGMVLDNMSDLVALLDTQGRRVFNSPSYGALFGDKPLAGTDSFVEIHPDHRERVRRVFRETVESGVGQRMHYRFLLADGRIRHIESQGDVVKDASGIVTHVVVVARDITERRLAAQALEEANRQLTATVQVLEQRHRQNLVLGKLADLMQMCTSIEESRSVAAQYVDELFPGSSGNLYLLDAGSHLFETAASWGDGALIGDPVIARDDCWALRRSAMHVVEDIRSKLVCPHLMVPPHGPCLCTPIQGNGELLGLL